ncbi:replication initiator protein A [Acidithiobacillus montserratensis]|uniref:Replication initiator protein A n=1 Tax=Acidithiobacillus montserratensis TaxID=2729135 RepID=A0ACD5HKG2_9PROT|nr:replication initiator protein A [Acidithiobacillus montserratensis]MBU2748539.1 replication initiator protein A [Acidithiobacillus montserratensis]
MSGEKPSGPVQIGMTLGDYLVERLKAAQASQEQGEEEQSKKSRRLIDRDHNEASQVVKSVGPSIRKPPKGDNQTDFFIPALYDVGTRDSRSIMDVAVFRLSKRDRRAGEVIRYELTDGYVEVSSGSAGMASIWDYDLVLMAISHLTESMNRFREGKGDKPGRVFRPHVADVLKFCRRADGGKQKDDLVETCIRLNTTHVAMQRTRKAKNGRVVTISEGEALISRYKVVKSETGRPEYIEIELADWMYREIAEGKNPDVLTVHPDYFLIDPGIGRFLYRLARRAAGKTEAKWSFKVLYDRSGSAGTFKEFCRILRRIIEANDLPEYTLQEEEGQSGPLMLMKHREADT